jgi:CRP-like cAMP-binding protein
MSSNSTENRRGLPGGGPSFMAPTLWLTGETVEYPVTAEDRAALSVIATIVRYRRGATIYEEGGDAGSVFNVITGLVKSCRILPDNKQHIVGFLSPNDLIGLAENGKYVNTAEAATAVTLYRMPAVAIEARLRRNAELDFHVIGKLCHELREAQDHSFLLSRHRAVAKLGLFLKMLESQQVLLGAGGGEVFLQMSRSDIGSYAGVSAETVSRSLRDLASRGIIGFRDRRHLQILDWPLLEATIAETTVH